MRTDSRRPGHAFLIEMCQWDWMVLLPVMIVWLRALLSDGRC